MQDLQISRITAEEFSDWVEDPDSMVAYRLQPEGLSFHQPVTLQINSQFEAIDSLPLLFHIHGDEVACDADHYHAADSPLAPVRLLEGTVRVDPEPGRFGFGRVSAVPS